jgi:GNAT superfamily N-acetyltransferase
VNGKRVQEEYMALLTWWQGDPWPTLGTLDGFRAAASDDAVLLATLSGYDVHEAQRRLHSHHRPYVASIGTTPVAYGWVSLEGAAIGELGVQVTLPAGNRYLWDFAALPDWRNRGIYPRLLQAILQIERQTAEQFWIIHTGNGASQAGIGKAGFRPVGELSFRRNGGAGLVPGGLHERASAGAALLGVPLIEEVLIMKATEQPLAPCWRCVIAARERGAGDTAVACWWTAPSSQLSLHQSACCCA